MRLQQCPISDLPSVAEVVHVLRVVSVRVALSCWHTDTTHKLGVKMIGHCSTEREKQNLSVPAKPCQGILMTYRTLSALVQECGDQSAYDMLNTDQPKQDISALDVLLNFLGTTGRRRTAFPRQGGLAHCRGLCWLRPICV